MGRDESDQTYIPFRTVIDLHGMKVNRVLLLRGALLSIFVVAGAADVARAQVFAPAKPSRPAAPSRAAAHADADSRAQALADADLSEMS